MRILDTLTTILVLGILSSTIAQEQIPSEDESTAGATSRRNIGNTGGSAPFGILSIFKNNNALMESCEINGGPMAYSTLEAAVRSVANCTAPLINSTELEVDKIAAFSHGKWDTVIAKYCRRLPAYLQCTKPVVDLAAFCLAPADRGFLKTNNNISTSLIEFLCQNDGNGTASFFTNGGLECMKSTRKNLKRKCPLENSGSDHTQLGDTPAWVQLAMNLTNCPMIESFGTCAVQVIRTCDNPTPANVVESVFDFLKRRNSCPSVPAAQAT